MGAFARAAGFAGHLVDRWRQSRGSESTGARRLLYRVTNPLRVLVAGLSDRPEAYVSTAPSPQHALDLFEGEWSSALPAPYNAYRAGRLPLFADSRLEWALEAMGGVADRTVIELGPLEGSHTYLLERRGARSITAIEAHPHAYLRCLVVKEILGLTRARFLLGDFVSYLRESDGLSADVGIASGVLYHLPEPIELVALLARTCQSVYLWTHYFDEAPLTRRPNVGARFEPPVRRTVLGFEHAVHPYSYQADRYRASFCGGARRSACWLDRQTLLDALTHFGFRHVQVGLEEPDHIHGPALAIVARKNPANGQR